MQADGLKCRIIRLSDFFVCVVSLCTLFLRTAEQDYVL